MHVEGMHTHKLAPKGGIPHTARQKCEHRKRLQEGKCSQPKKLSHCALLNVCISFNNANMERVQAPQQIGTLECQSMKRQSPLGEPQQSLKLHVHIEWKGVLLTSASHNEHCQHYRSCVTEQRRQKTGCRPPYK